MMADEPAFRDDEGFMTVPNYDASRPDLIQYPQGTLDVARAMITQLPIAKRPAALDLLTRNEMRLLHNYLMEELPR